MSGYRGDGPISLVVLLNDESSSTQSNDPHHASNVLTNEVDQFAMAEASTYGGDDTPTQVAWQPTTLGNAASLLAATEFVEGSSSSTAVYALEISGDFDAPAAPEQNTSTLWVVVQSSNWTVEGWGVTNHPAALASAEIDPLTGLQPESMHSWRRKFDPHHPG